MESIISNLITTLGAFVLVYLSVIKDNYSSKYKIRREQLDKFYIPFYKLYCRGFLSENPLSLMTPEVRGSILELLNDNIHLMEPLSQSMYSRYYKSYLDLLEAEDGCSHFSLSEARAQMDSTFKVLSQSIFMEYNQLLKKAKLPVPMPLHRV